MKSHDELMQMSETEREAYRKAEVERLIQSAPAKHQLKLRAIQAKCDGIRSRVKNPLVSARMMFDKMMASYEELKNRLNGG